MTKIKFQEIGKIYSPFKTLGGMPIQPSGAKGVEGRVEVYSEYTEGLKDLAGFSHIYLLYFLHKVSRQSLLVTPFLDDISRGVFATRAPVRSNPIGLSVVELVEVKANVLKVRNIDILDGIPLLDIKPYIPEFDYHPAARVGWLESNKKRIKRTKSDHRFS